ncbi:conserved hypothetical protein [Sphingomonas sp. 8AM]|nr:conserved hypothetical protein [Sphingomonas sp. 8AM]
MRRVAHHRHLAAMPVVRRELAQQRALPRPVRADEYRHRLTPPSALGKTKHPKQQLAAPHPRLGTPGFIPIRLRRLS